MCCRSRKQRAGPVRSKEAFRQRLRGADGAGAESSEQKRVAGKSRGGEDCIEEIFPVIHQRREKLPVGGSVFAKRSCGLIQGLVDERGRLIIEGMGEGNLRFRKFHIKRRLRSHEASSP